jgi:hypothetical protein
MFTQRTPFNPGFVRVQSGLDNLKRLHVTATPSACVQGGAL